MTSGESIEELQEVLLNGMEQNPPKKRKMISCVPSLYWFFYHDPKNFLIIIPSLFAGIMSIVVHFFSGRIIDGLSELDPFKCVLRESVSCFLVSIVITLFSTLSTIGWVRIGSSISMKAKSLIFKTLMKQEVEYFDSHSIGDFLNALNTDTSSVENAFTSIKGFQCRCIGQFLVSLATCFSVDWRFFIFDLFVTCLAAAFSNVFRAVARRNNKPRFAAQGRVANVAEEAVSNVRVVQSFNRQQYEVGRLEFHANEVNHYDLMISLGNKFGFCTGYLLTWSSVCAILNVGAYMLISGKVTAGKIFTISRSTFMGAIGLRNLMGTLMTEVKGLDSAERIFKLVDELPFQSHGERTIPDFKGDIEFRNVWFKYPTRDVWILKGISFHLSPGEIAAFVGHSGSGKSTIVQLVLRFYDVNEGAILFDGINIKEIDPRWIHRMIGVVQQDPALFAMSIRDNICYSDPNVTDEQIAEAMRIANIEKFVSKLPDGLNTYVGEKGNQISGGQRQRIAIARAVIKNSPVLITDEATSALDATSEFKVQKALDNLMQGKTSLVIAHRLGTIKAAKRIFVFESGKLVEEGTHEELIEKRGSYFSLVERQLLKTQGSDEEMSSSTSTNFETK